MQHYISKKVGSIVFGLLSPKLINKMAAVKIVTPELYDKEGYPVDGGLMDVRLGVIDPGLRCKTCGGKLKECIGHFGYIELARPVIHIKFVVPIFRILRSSCRECCRILVENERLQNFLNSLKEFEAGKNQDLKKKKVKEFFALIKGSKKCPHCQAKQHEIKFEKPSNYFENEKRLNPIEVRSRLEKVSDDDVRALGFNPDFARPEWMVLTVLPIPPVTTRPSITLETGERSEDDLTHKLGDIVRINQRLFENINAGAPEVIIEDLWDLLQYHITTYFDNEVTQVPPARHRSGQSLKTLTERIKSKEGRFRHNLAGKRVNYAARTVISPDPRLKFNEVGVPKVIAMELTIPERVTEWNIKYLKKFVEKGPHNYPGANYVLRPDGKKKKITDETREQLLEELQPGYIVERHMMDGDIAIFNRQPSLHRMSIMCHKIKILPGKSFRLNPSICVAPDTKVMMSEGCIREIRNLKDYKNKDIITCNWEKDRELENSKINKFHGINPQEYNLKCFKITTITGRSIRVTEDHPFYTQEGILPAKLLKEGDKVAVYPIDLPEYEEKDDVILTENDIIKFIPKKANSNNVIKTLKKLNLLPLRMNNLKLPILARILGHIFGDGSLIYGRSGSYGTDRKSLITSFRGDVDDLEIIKQEINKLGFNNNYKIISKISKNKIRTFEKTKDVIGLSNWFSIKSQPLGSLLLALEAPLGRRTDVKYRLPKWIFNSPLFIKRNFLGSYFGSELSKPRTGTRSKKSMSAPVFKIQKRHDLIKNGRMLAKDFSTLLKDFDIDIFGIRIEEGNVRKDNSKTYTIITEISSKTKNLKNLFGKIGYIYASRKEKSARLAYHYLENKDILINEQINKLNKTKLLYSKNYLPKDIAKMLDIPRGTISTWLYRKPKTNQYVTKDFLNFNEFIKNSTRGLSKTGVVWESIKDKKEVETFIAQDITTKNKNHNFIANGFIVGNCAPYNADFDGDEMNLHIPQTEEARSEAEVLMQVQSHIITPKNGLNVIGCIDDSIAGNYLLTKKLEFERKEAIALLISIGVENSEKFKKFSKRVSGKEVFSALLPNDFDFMGHSKGANKEDKFNVIIKKGQLTSGVIDKATIGEENGTLIRALYAQYGEDVGIDLLNKIFRLGIEVLLRKGFTTAISDTDLPDKTRQTCNLITEEARAKVNEFIEERKSGKLEAIPGYTIDETLEFKILEILNKARNAVGEAVASIADENNPTIIMSASGAKGNILHLAQMAACVGQQALRGRRIDKGFTNRTLSTFKPNDLSPEAKGFIKHGFKNGLSPTEFFFGAMTGRDSLMDTALRTPKSGYLYRRLANALQDLKVEYDHTVRDANKKIIQFKYGEDSIDISKSEGGTINYKKIIKEVAGE